MRMKNYNSRAIAKGATSIGATVKVALTIVVLLFVGCGSTITERVIVRERIDTLRVQGDSVFIEGPSSSFVLDTIQKEPPLNLPLKEGEKKAFVASLDTTVERIRLQAKYWHPSNRWRIGILQRDTVVRYLVRDSIKVESHVEKVAVTPAWVYVLLVVLGLAGGGALIIKLKSSIHL